MIAHMQYDHPMHLRRRALSTLVVCCALLGTTVLLARQAPAAKPPIPAPADVAAAPADAEKTASGLASKVLQKGTGDKRPTTQDMAVVHYTGWTTDGKMFDSSVARGTPNTFPVGGLIKGFTEG